MTEYIIIKMYDWYDSEHVVPCNTQWRETDNIEEIHKKVDKINNYKDRLLNSEYIGSKYYVVEKPILDDIDELSDKVDEYIKEETDKKRKADEKRKKTKERNEKKRIEKLRIELEKLEGAQNG